MIKRVRLASFRPPLGPPSFALWTSAPCPDTPVRRKGQPHLLRRLLGGRARRGCASAVRLHGHVLRPVLGQVRAVREGVGVGRCRITSAAPPERSAPEGF